MRHLTQKQLLFVPTHCKNNIKEQRGRGRARSRGKHRIVLKKLTKIWRKFSHVVFLCDKKEGGEGVEGKTKEKQVRNKALAPIEESTPYIIIF